VLAIVMGVYPKPFFDVMHESVATTIRRVPPGAIALAGHVGDVPKPKGIRVKAPVPGPHGETQPPAWPEAAGHGE
jgi:hypothetical protein